jgi:hypothetical protein
MRYVCAIHNQQVRHCFTSDAQVETRFAESWNKQGWDVYDCVAELKDNAQVRSLETVKELAFLHVDLDLRSLETPCGEVLAALESLPLPLEVRDSGGGFHAIAWLKEPVEANTPEFDRANAARKQLTYLLAGDPAPDHAAALLRRVDTRNFKYGEPRLCHVIQAGEPVDLTEVEELIELLGDTPLFVTKAKAVATNGHNASPVPQQRINAEAALAAMAHESKEHGIHNTQLSVAASRLLAGMTVDSIVIELMDATRQSVGNDPSWNWQQEEVRIRRMIYDWFNKQVGERPELVDQLPEPFQSQWRAREAAGDRCLQIKYSGIQGGCFVLYGRKAVDEPTGPSDPSNVPPDKPAQRAEPPQKPKEAPKRKEIRAIPFEPFDEASFPRRQFLYAMHYQCGQCTCSVGQDGAGKSTVSIGEGIAMATARNVLKEEPVERCRVWLHNADDDTQEVYRRIAAFCRHNGIPQEDLRGWLFATGKDSFNIRVATGNGQFVPEHGTVAAITETITDNQIDVAIFDPLVALHAVAENDNVRMSEVIHIFSRIAANCDCAIDVAHMSASRATARMRRNTAPMMRAGRQRCGQRCGRPASSTACHARKP